MKKLPEKLYKYRPFGVPALRTLTAAEVFYAHPNSFNDPLDSKPSIVPDIPWNEAENLWRQMVLGDARGSSIDHDLLVKRVADQRGSHQYMASQYGGRHDDGGAGTEIYLRHICTDIDRLLQKALGSHGILSLGGKWDCPLMWSHYGDQHRGVCIEFSTAGQKPKHLDAGAVHYDRGRTIALSQFARWQLDGSIEDKNSILDTYFFNKAPEWAYEQEYRVISQKVGVGEIPFLISAVYFGLRADDATKAAVINLARPNDSIEFYSIYAADDGFKLKRYDASADEVRATGGIRRPAWSDFADLDPTSTEE